MAASADAIMPAASSLFSRAYGRYDLAWFLARSLSVQHGVKLINPPWHFYFSLQKRSQLKREEEVFPLYEFTRGSSKKPKLLLIDDVLTTGFTLEKLCRQSEAHYFPQALTLAYARRHS